MSTTTAAFPIAAASLRPRSRAAVTAAYFAAFVALGLTTALLGPTLLGLAKHTNARLSAISYLFTARSLGYVLGALRGGGLYDRRAGNSVMAVALIVMAALTMVVPFTVTLWTLLVAMLMLGTAEAILDVGANTLLARVYGEQVGPLMNALHCFFGLGALISPVIVALVVALGHDAIDTYKIIALLLLPVGVWLLLMPSPMAPAAEKVPPASASNRTLVLLIASFLFLYVGAEVGFGGWISTYAVTRKLSSSTSAAYLTSIFWGALTIGRLLGILIAKRFPHGYVLLADLAGCTLSLGIILVFSYSFGVVVVGVFSLGLCMASIFPTVLSFAGQQVKLTGQVTGRFILGASLGAMTVPLLIGQVFETLGPQVVMFVVLSAVLLAGAILIFLLRQLGRRSGSGGVGETS